MIDAVCLLLVRDPYGWAGTVWEADCSRLAHPRLGVYVWLHRSGSVFINESKLNWWQARRVRKALDTRMVSMSQDVLLAKLDEPD